MFRIITLEREFGCGCAFIGSELARQLGWKLWDQNLTCEIARRAHVAESEVAQCEERVDSLLYRFAKTFWRGSYERSLPLAGSTAFDTDRMITIMEEIMRNIAEEGNAVVVGRGAPFFMRGRSDTFSVFTYAPYEEKMRRLLKMDKSREEAEELLESVDKERIAFVKHYFNADWPSRSLYHLMINTSMGDERVISTILDTMHALESSTSEQQMSAIR